jgi:hypothetical protein
VNFWFFRPGSAMVWPELLPPISVTATFLRDLLQTLPWQNPNNVSLSNIH